MGKQMVFPSISSITHLVDEWLRDALSRAEKIGFKSLPHSLLTFLTPSPPPISPLQREVNNANSR